jgi:hypothetical protein
MGHINSRNKGAAGEREWCKFLRDHGWAKAERDIEQSRSGGGDVPVPPVLYEVKRYNQIAVRKWLDQSTKSVVDYKECSIPVVAMREDGRTDWMILLSAEDFVKLLKLNH